MDILEVMKSRRVQRAYADRPVEVDKLRAIIDAGRQAMSARNLQPWNFIVIRDRATIARLAEYCTTGKFIVGAPAAIVVLKDTNNARWADVDCGQAVMNMANAGWAMGLGTCWIGNFEAEQITKLLAIPPGWGVFTVLPFGYQDEKNPPQAKPLKPRTEVVHFERFGSHRG